MNSDMVKPEKFGHLHLVYHFTVPSRGHENFPHTLKISFLKLYYTTEKVTNLLFSENISRSLLEIIKIIN